MPADFTIAETKNAEDITGRHVLVTCGRYEARALVLPRVRLDREWPLPHARDAEVDSLVARLTITDTAQGKPRRVFEWSRGRCCRDRADAEVLALVDRLAVELPPLVYPDATR